MKKHTLSLLLIPLLLTGCSTTNSEPAQTTVTKTATIVDTVTETVTEYATVESDQENSTSSEPETKASTEPDTDNSLNSSKPVTFSDEIGAETVRGFGVGISNQQFANVSSEICDHFENGGTLSGAKQLVTDEVPLSDWEAVKVVQGAVVQKCVQYSDSTY